MGAFFIIGGSPISKGFIATITDGAVLKYVIGMALCSVFYH